MKRYKSILATVSVFTVIFATEIFANYTTSTYHLGKNTLHSYLCYKSSNTDKFDYRLNNVWPDNGDEDTYKRAKLGLKNINGSWIMPEIVVTEDALRTISYDYSSKYDLDARDPVTFTIRGNDPKLSAYANVYTNWY